MTFRILMKVMNGQEHEVETLEAEDVEQAFSRAKDLASVGVEIKDGPDGRDRVLIPPSSILFLRVTPNSFEEDVELQRQLLTRAQLELKA